jgi:transglutaminase superfamily protein
MRRLSGADYRLLMRVLPLALAVAIALRTLRWTAVRGLVASLKSRTSDRDDLSADRLVWALNVVGHRVPPLRNCLVRALVAEIALGSSALPVRVTIGVERAAGSVEAHAWVEQNGRVILGGSGDPASSADARYAPIVTWQSPR